jgi:ABC-type transport system substrate-binding protein
MAACDDHAILNNPHKAEESLANISYKAFPERPKTLDPARSYSHNESLFTAQIYEPPLQYHYLKRPYTLVPLSAAAMPRVKFLDINKKPLPDDAKPDKVAYSVYEIQIQPGILYQPHPAFAQDNDKRHIYHNIKPGDLQTIYRLGDFDHTGFRELVAADYVYQIKRLAHPTLNSPILGVMVKYIEGLKEYAQTLRQVFQPNAYLDLRTYKLSGVEIIDRYQYRITIMGIYPQISYWLAMPFFAVYLADAGKPLPFIDKVIYSLEKENIPRWHKFLQGYYDKSKISSDSFDQAIKINEDGQAQLTPMMQARDIRLQTSIEASVYFMAFNMLDDIVGGNSERARKLRQAIAIAVDFEEYVSIFLNGRGIAAQGPIPPGIFGYLSGQEGVNPVTHYWHKVNQKRKSLDAAKKLLAEAGYPEGRDINTGRPLLLNYEVVSIGGPGDRARFDWYRKQFAKLGVQLNIRVTQYNRFQDKIRNGIAQVFSWGWLADYPDPENFLFLLYGPNGKVKYGGENAANYQNPRYDTLFEKMKHMPNGPERQNVIDQMLAIVRHESPWLWGFHTKDFELSHAWNRISKPNTIANNTLKYERLEPVVRAARRDQWNQPTFFPLLILAGIVLTILISAFTIYRRNEHKSNTRKFEPYSEIKNQR